MSFKPDGKSIVDVTNTQLGAEVSALAAETIMKLHDIVSNSPNIKSHSNSVVGYMLNDTMVFMQFIEYLITGHKASTASAYQKTAEQFRDVL